MVYFYCTELTKVEWSSISPSWRLAWTEVLKKFRKVEFGVEIEVILQQSRVLLHDLQYTVQFAIKEKRMMTTQTVKQFHQPIKVLTATRTHAQCVLRMRNVYCACAVHNNGQRRRVQKSDAGADEKLKINK